MMAVPSMPCVSTSAYGREVRAELAHNLVHVYRTLAEPAQCREWLNKAQDWTPARNQ
jgi:hypothetical protein